jgi:hypothetical protein
MPGGGGAQPKKRKERAAKYRFTDAANQPDSFDLHPRSCSVKVGQIY